MQKVLKSPRNGCGLHGAVQTLEEIKGVVPIVHSNAGCAVQNYLANKASGMGNGYISGDAVFATDVQERHVIFGGASRLREQIKNTLKVAEGELYVVLNSCESAMVGDDIEAMTREAVEQGEPVIECLTAGFHGDAHYGYASVMMDLVKKLPPVKEPYSQKDERLVNLFGILPAKDIYFKGNLAELKRLLNGLGLSVNTFFGPVDGVEELRLASAASLSLVFSKWGVQAAEELKERYGIPVLQFPAAPVGYAAVEQFVHSVAEALPLEKETVEAFLAKERQEFFYYFHGAVETFYEENAAKAVALVGDEALLIQTAGFLKEYLGATIEAAIVTDYFGREDAPKEEKSEVLSRLAKEVYFTQDGAEIRNILQHSEAEMVLGSSLEEEIAKKRGIPLLQLTYPVYGRTVLNKSYVGIRGALSLAEDYLTKVKEANRLREDALLEYMNGGRHE